MRNLAALVLLLAACAADPVIAPRDCTPGTTSACACPGASGVQTCTASGTVGACVCPDAGGGDAVAVADAPAVDVVTPEDRPAPVDVVAVADAGTDAVDAPVVDVDPRQTPECRAVNQTCDGRRVNVQRGERDGGVTYHCGRCGNTCAVPMSRAAPHVAAFCDGCVCVIDCEGDYRDCDGNPANGCEALFGDNNNCGACGRRCLSNQHCTPPPHMCAF